MAACGVGFGAVDPDTGDLRMVASLGADQPLVRMNDGKCDRAGRFWAGTQRLDLAPGGGGLYRLGVDGSMDLMVPDVTISNGLGWSPDDRTMYFIDTASGGIDAFDFDLDDGMIRSRRRLVDLDPRFGKGDGLTVDASGCLWVARWAGWVVDRYDPEGALDVRIRVPVSHPTSCAFGGADLGDLYITSASSDEEGPLGAADMRREPNAGALFCLRPGVGGLPATSYWG